MLVKFPLVAIGRLVDWRRRRAEQKALLKATDELSGSRDDMLSDIGITRDELMFASLRRGKGRPRCREAHRIARLRFRRGHHPTHTKSPARAGCVRTD